MIDAQRLATELLELEHSQILLKRYLSKRLRHFPMELQNQLKETLGVTDLAITSCESSISDGNFGYALTCLIAAAGATGTSAGIVAALGNDGVRDIMRSHTARLGAEIANAPKAAARAKVRELWFQLTERERATRGAVLRFATRTAPDVKGSTVGGIKRWVAEFRKESRSR